MDSETKNLVDEFDNLQNIKREIEEKISKIRDDIIKLSLERNTEIIFGTHKKCSVKEYEKVIYPEDKTQLVNIIKSKGLYDRFSSLNYFKLSPRILKNEVDQSIINLVKKEKAFRVSLTERGI